MLKAFRAAQSFTPALLVQELKSSTELGGMSHVHIQNVHGQVFLLTFIVWFVPAFIQTRYGMLLSRFNVDIFVEG